MRISPVGAATLLLAAACADRAHDAPPREPADAGWTAPGAAETPGGATLRGSHLADLRAGPAAALHALFVTGPGGGGRPGRLLYAEFDGSRWSTPVALDETSGSIGPAQVVADGAGRVHAFWLAGPPPASPADPPPLTTLLYRWREGGRWSPAERLYAAPAGTPLPASGLAAARVGDAVHVIHPRLPDRFADLVFTGTGRVLLPAGRSGGEPRLEAGPDGTLALADLKSTLSALAAPGTVFHTDPWVRVFRGRRWSEPVLVDATPGQDSHKPQVAWSRDGALHVVWLEADPGELLPTHLFHSRSDDGRTWSPAVEPAAAAPGRVFYSPRLALDGGRTLHLTFTRFADGLSGPRHFHLSLRGGRWSPPREILPGPGLRGAEMETAADARGVLHALWIGPGGDPVHAALPPAPR